MHSIVEALGICGSSIKIRWFFFFGTRRENKEKSKEKTI
jgi:hypothetical protein